MRLYKRGRTYWIRWGENGIKYRESTRCTDKKAAELYLKRREREKADPAHHAAHEATIEGATERFRSELTSAPLAPGTKKMYDVKTRHVARLLGSVRLIEINHERILQYARDREDEGCDPHTVHKELVTIRKILFSAYRAGEFTRDPKTVMPSYSTEYKPTEQWVDEDVLWRVIRELEPGRGAFLAYIVIGGANTGDVERARREDLEDLSLRIRGSKTSARHRTVPIVSIFKRFAAFVRKHADGTGKLLFRPWLNMRRDLHAACLRAQTCPSCRGKGKFRPTDGCAACEPLAFELFNATKLRHTTATWLVRGGVSFEYVAKILGLKSTAMLFRVYGHLEALDAAPLIEQQLRLRRTRHEKSGAQKAHRKRRRVAPPQKYH